MKKLFLLPILFATFAFAQHSYSTSFPLTENPISEGGKWVNGGTTGLDWTNILTTGGVKAYGSSTGSGQGYDDSTAVLQGMGFTWGQNQTSTGIVYLNNAGNAHDPEVELRLNTTISAHRITGYMCSWSVKSDGTQYFGFGRWDGAFGDFVGSPPLLPGGVITGFPALKNGDVVSCQRVGNVITAYINGVLISNSTGTARITDSTYLGGSPGISTDLDSNGARINGTFGFSSFSATDVSGTRPTGANYLNTTGQSVTLAGLGVNSCYYIAANGSDAYTGLNELIPWFHAPQMLNCSDNCATLQNSNAMNGTAAAGLGFIFRGGDTWHFGIANPVCSGSNVKAESREVIESHP